MRRKAMTLALILFVFAFFIGLVMELYKKKIRKDKAGDWENMGVAFTLSFILGFLFFRIVVTIETINTITTTPLLIIPSSILIYILQRPVCMSFWKPLLKKWIERRLK